MKSMENSLRDLGFNQYESRVYLSLLHEGPLTASAVSAKAKIPRPRVYDVLDSLSSRGIVITHPGRPGKFHAVDTDTLIELLKKEEEEKFQKRINSYEKVRKVLEGTKLSKKNTNGETVWVLKGEKTIHGKIREIIQNSEQEIIISGNNLSKKMSLHKNLLNTASEKGVKIKLISEKPGDFPVTEHVKRDSVHMIIGDSEAVLFLNKKEGNHAIWVKSNHLTEDLKKMLKK